MKISEEPTVVVLPPDHPMKFCEKFPLAALGDQSLILLEKNHDSDSHHVLEEFQKRYGKTLDTKYVSDQIYTILSMVESGMGVSVLPVAAAAREYNIITKEIDPPFKRVLIMAAKSFSSVSPAAEKFIAHYKFLLKEYGPRQDLLGLYADIAGFYGKS